jgi:Icc-related predicted phosphoesterase
VSDAEGQRECVRVAAAGDIHIRKANADHVKEAFQAIAPQADLILLAGDLTTHGEPGQAAFLAEACDGIEIPVVAVLGNHDFHCDRAQELSAALEDAGITVLERSSQVFEVDRIEVGVVGAKGFVGGFAGSHLPDFGEPLLREVYRETSDEVDAIAEGLVAVAHCPLRIVLLHYAPIEATVEGEPAGIHTFLGSSRLADPIREHEPDLVLHGHAHAGTFAGSIGPTPVHNVSVPVMKQDFWLFELQAEERAAPPIH